MKTKEIKVVLQQLKDTVANAQCLIASIEAMLESENEDSKEEIPEETPVVNDEPSKEEREILPEPPKEIHVKLPKAKVKTPDFESIIGCQILTALPDFYDGKCSLIKLHKRYFDNGKPRLFIDKYHVVIEAYDSDMNLLGSTVTHWNNLGKFHIELVKRGINTHKGDNWMPKTICLDLD